MTKQEIKILRDKVGTDLILTDEEIEYIWTAMDKAEAQKPDSLKFPTAEIFICPSCEHIPNWPHDYCPKCGQKIDWDNRGLSIQETNENCRKGIDHEDIKAIVL